MVQNVPDQKTSMLLKDMIYLSNIDINILKRFCGNICLQPSLKEQRSS